MFFSSWSILVGNQNSHKITCEIADMEGKWVVGNKKIKRWAGCFVNDKANILKVNFFTSGNKLIEIV